MKGELTCEEAGWLLRAGQFHHAVRVYNLPLSQPQPLIQALLEDPLLKKTGLAPFLALLEQADRQTLCCNQVLMQRGRVPAWVFVLQEGILYKLVGEATQLVPRYSFLGAREALLRQPLAYEVHSKSKATCIRISVPLF